MSTPVSQLTVEQVDKIAVKYEQLDSDECGAVDTPALMLRLPNWHVSLLI